MPSRNAISHSLDPLDHPSDRADDSIADRVIDPLDQVNEKRLFATPSSAASPPATTAPIESSAPIEPSWRRPLDIRALRKRLGMPQRLFAGSFGFPVATLRHWERGNRRPSGTALVLLHVINEHPNLVMRAVRKARLRDPGSIAPIEQITSTRLRPGFALRPLPRRHPR